MLLFSLVFYAWGEPIYVLVMLFSILANYLLAMLIAIQTKPSLQKALLIVAVVANLSLLVYFKYANFIIDNVNFVLSRFTLFRLQNVAVSMPIGISFFTFQALSYVIDVYRQQVKATPKITTVALYISLFPQLIAGPIVRYIDVAKEIEERAFDFTTFVSGIRRFIVGLGKKVLIANSVALVADDIFALAFSSVTPALAWIGILCYSLQIYYDFSGYSDMAIGLGKMFGFTFLENFNYPYSAKSITDFWRRWHISLSTWFRDYLYIPLGGNRKGKSRTYINSLIVFFTTGLWHGASWNFIVWGLYHGVFLTVEKMRGVKHAVFSGHSPFAKQTARFFSHAVTIFIVLIGWVFFRADTLSSAVDYIARMFFITAPDMVLLSPSYFLNGRMLLIIAVAVLFSAPLLQLVLKRTPFSPQRHPIVALTGDIGLVCIFLFSIMALSSSVYNPFIYFRF